MIHIRKINYSGLWGGKILGSFDTLGEARDYLIVRVWRAEKRGDDVSELKTDRWEFVNDDQADGTVLYIDLNLTECDWCGSKFEAQNDKQEFCEDSCAESYYG